MRSKQIAYAKLISRFKQYKFEGLALENPFNLKVSSELPDHLNPWAHWQGKLDAKILLIGQDWGDVNFYHTNGGKDPDDGNLTNEALNKLFSSNGYETGTPRNPGKTSPVYFTNAVIELKTGGKAAPIKTKWYTSTINEFLKPLIEDVIQPEIIIAMGSKAFDAAFRMYNLSKMPFKAATEKGGFDLPNGRKLYIVAHCSRLGQANRNFELQLKDWCMIKQFLNELK